MNYWQRSAGKLATCRSPPWPSSSSPSVSPCTYPGSWLGASTRCRRCWPSPTLTFLAWPELTPTMSSELPMPSSGSKPSWTHPLKERPHLPAVRGKMEVGVVVEAVAAAAVVVVVVVAVGAVLGRNRTVEVELKTKSDASRVRKSAHHDFFSLILWMPTLASLTTLTYSSVWMSVAFSFFSGTYLCGWCVFILIDTAVNFTLALV